jgi:hypothetical protein
MFRKMFRPEEEEVSSEYRNMYSACDMVTNKQFDIGTGNNAKMRM